MRQSGKNDGSGEFYNVDCIVDWLAGVWSAGSLRIAAGGVFTHAAAAAGHGGRGPGSRGAGVGEMQGRGARSLF